MSVHAFRDRREFGRAARAIRTIERMEPLRNAKRRTPRRGPSGAALLTAQSEAPIDAGTPDAPSEGAAEVFRVAADGTTESLGQQTVWNPYRHEVMGALAVAQLDDANFLIVGYDLLEALWLIENSGARTVLHIPEGAMSPTDIRWQDTIKCTEVT